MDEILQFDYRQTDAFWKASMNNDLSLMKEIALNPRVSINLQKKHQTNLVQTPLDWAISHNNNDMINWLCERGAWSFKFRMKAFNDQYPNIKQQYCGRKSFKYWLAAQQGNLESMIVVEYDIEGGKFSPNSIREGLTPLDLAVKDKNSKIAIHLISRGAKLCYYSVEDFNRIFPNLSGKVLKSEDIIEEKFDADYPELSLLIYDNDDKHLLIETFLGYIKQKENEYQQKMIALAREYDGIFMQLSGIKKMDFLGKKVSTWSSSEVSDWIKNKCGSCPTSTLDITGKDLLELSVTTMLSMNMSKEQIKILMKEITSLKDEIIIPTIYYATTNYYSMILRAKPIKYQDEIFLHLRKLIQLHCIKEDITQDKGLKFFLELQQEALKESNDPMTICLKLWKSSANLDGVRLMSILCESVKSDNRNLLKISLPIINVICHSSFLTRELIVWPQNNLLYAKESRKDISMFTSNKKFRYSSLISATATKPNDESILYIFHLSDRKGCKCYNISVIDLEFIFHPYSVFTVRSITNTTIELDVAVNSEEESEFLSLI